MLSAEKRLIKKYSKFNVLYRAKVVATAKAIGVITLLLLGFIWSAS